MSLRYLRHGLYTKRQKLKENNFPQFIDNLIWNVTNYHYKNYFNNIVKFNFLNNQHDINELLKLFKVNRDNLTSLNFLRFGLPKVTPFRAQSNPFCPNSTNRRGFEFYHRRFLKSPRPWKNKRISIDDLNVPIYPKHF